MSAARRRAMALTQTAVKRCFGCGAIAASVPSTFVYMVSMASRLWRSAVIAATAVASTRAPSEPSSRWKDNRLRATGISAAKRDATATPVPSSARWTGSCARIVSRSWPRYHSRERDRRRFFWPWAQWRIPRCQNPWRGVGKAPSTSGRLAMGQRGGPRNQRHVRVRHGARRRMAVAYAALAPSRRRSSPERRSTATATSAAVCPERLP
mmetsp:Transcript_41244/g.113761  ORF Transcript_41244/g.113761 Transcript_41244/m.113761 type:complete len:209 (+) Transcript_41244:242-868(+)